jgi:hypothetical protein
MGQQIPIDAALAGFRKKCGELIDANVLLEVRAEGLQARVAELEEENARLHQAAEGPVSGGPDLAAQPPYPAKDT